MISSVFSSSIRVCDTPMLAENVTITLIPENPSAGGTYVVGVDLQIPSSSSPIIDGTQSIVVTLSGFPIVNTNEKLCENVPCPIVPGWNNNTWPGNVPSGVHGNVVIREIWNTLNHDEIVCFEVGYSL